MKKLGVLATLLLSAVTSHAQKVKTTFQIAEKWRPEYDVRADVVMLYGMDSTFHDRLTSWKQQGYGIQFMTGIAWGNYQDYFSGKFDGKTHWEESQTDINGHVIGHGRDVPYIVPTESYITYMKSRVKKAIDEGVTAIYLEEPEFWARGGYSEPFKKEWQKFYGFPWMAQDKSPEATYLSSKLKYQLYFNALKEVFLYVSEYSHKKVKCYVPTHSLLNYAAWQIVSPEASLAALPGMDGYIAQVWTGTSREPVYFNGVKKERVFENAFMEYGTLYSMIAPTHKDVYFLTDPIEDRPRSWDDYKRNYQATFTAQLMYPNVDHYEVMPWPNRIYLGKFKVENTDSLQHISSAYATQMQVMVNTLNDMPKSTNKVSGTPGIGVLLGNSIMFQRFPTHKDYEDPQLSNFYGMVMPLLKRGIPVQTVHMENLGFPDALANIKVLIMSYSDMKPYSQKVHQQLAAWVNKGGKLIYIGRDNDPFQEVKEWWNSNGLTYKAPSEDLFRRLKDKVVIVRKDPKELVLAPDQDSDYVALVKISYGKGWQTKNNFILDRGPYKIVSVLDENTDKTPVSIKGKMIDLFDPELPVINEKIINPGEQAFLYTIPAATTPKVLCAAARITNGYYGPYLTTDFSP
ncbi:hypothetical protein GO495_31705 [Chitinophaga oryziterrae]|uniref:Beta-galactosidase trimerisation domain-containing protein n=1 Tax=Chitinophaga oryziterrae TaxID=1031224 RepID=A0A6N8JIY0_9BACT|nr:hypothetical protein [Chitinophaga oryziterrae]MVT45197.1 hypothetical protein [Chitinophaga oryziterrae]